MQRTLGGNQSQIETKNGSEPTEYKRDFIQIRFETRGGEPIEYKKEFVKIGFKSNNDLLLGKILTIPSIIINTKSVFQKDSKYYLQVCLHEDAYKFVNEL